MDLKKLLELTLLFLRNNVLRFKVENPESVAKPIADSIQSVSERIEDGSERLEKVLAHIEVMKGEPGHTPTDEELLNLIRPLIPERAKDGEDGRTPTEQELLALINPLIPKVKDGKTPTKAELRSLILPLIPDPIKGDSPTKDEIEKLIKPLIPAVKDGSPDTPEQVKEKLESLEGDDRLDAKAIKNLPNPGWGGGGGIKRIDGANDTRIINPTNGQTLIWNDSRKVWENGTVSGGSGTPGGSDTQVQFNDGGAFGGDAGLVYNKTTDRLTAGNVAVTDDAYDATAWNGSLEVPTKNAVRDKIELLQPLDAELTALAGLTSAANKIPMFSGSGSATLLDLDTDISSVSASDDSVPSAKATKTALDLKLPLAGGTMSGNITLGENTSIALDPAGSADGKYSGITVTGTGGDTIAFGDLVTLDKDDSRWEKVDISVAAAATGDARGIIGIAVTSSTDGGAITVLLNGIIRADANFPALTIGAPVYASTTGDIVVSHPTTTDYVIRIVGYALTADEIYFNPGNVWITHT